MKRGCAPTADQKRWHSWVAAQGCYLGLGNAELHHPVGSCGIHNKVRIGQWWVAPLHAEAHRGRGGIHGDLSLFAGHGLGETRKEIEKTIFRRLVAHYHARHGELPMPADVIAAIEDWHL